jgi:protoporphyrinogen IX oxidase
MLWIKSFHIIAMVAWFCGLFYLPRLFVYHATANDQLSIERFKIMEKKLFYYIMTPAALLTIFFGVYLISFNVSAYMHMGWLHLKLSLVLGLIIYHLYLGMLVKNFAVNSNKHSALFYRFLNEIPTVLLVAIVLLVVVKPF